MSIFLSIIAPKKQRLASNIELTSNYSSTDGILVLLSSTVKPVPNYPPFSLILGFHWHDLQKRLHWVLNCLKTNSKTRSVCVQRWHSWRLACRVIKMWKVRWRTLRYVTTWKQQPYATMVQKQKGRSTDEWKLAPYHLSFHYTRETEAINFLDIFLVVKVQPACGCFLKVNLQAGVLFRQSLKTPHFKWPFNGQAGEC